MHHVSLDRIAFTISGILLAFAAVAGFGLRSGGDPFALRLMPALALRLQRPFVVGGDFPPSLSGAGVVAVYVVPAAVFSLSLCGGASENAPPMSILCPTPNERWSC